MGANLHAVAEVRGDDKSHWCMQALAPRELLIKHDAATRFEWQHFRGVISVSGEGGPIEPQGGSCCVHECAQHSVRNDGVLDLARFLARRLPQPATSVADRQECNHRRVTGRVPVGKAGWERNPVQVWVCQDARSRMVSCRGVEWVSKHTNPAGAFVF